MSAHPSRLPLEARASFSGMIQACLISACMPRDAYIPVWACLSALQRGQSEAGCSCCTVRGSLEDP